MSILTRTPPRVHPDPLGLAVEPIRYHSDPSPVEPSAEDEAFHLGYTLEREGEDAHPPRGWHFAEVMEFYRGMYWARLDAARDAALDREAWLDQAYAALPPIETQPCFAELAEAGGCDFARAYQG